MMAIFWACLFVILLILELMTAGLVTIWFCGGAIVALVLSLFNLPVWIQVSAFAVVSILLLIFTRPIVKKLKNKKVAPMNTDRVLNRKCVVLEDINGLSASGSVKIDGIIWSAIAKDENQTIAKGTKVIVKKVDGVKVIVEPCTDKEE